MLASELEKVARLDAYERGELQSVTAESVFAQARLLGR